MIQEVKKFERIVFSGCTPPAADAAGADTPAALAAEDGGVTGAKKHYQLDEE